VGSSEVDWFLAERLVSEYRQASPFDEFLRKAIKALSSPTVVRGARNDAEYARIIEERRCLIDVLDRAEMLAFTYSRLRALTGLYWEAEVQIHANCVVSEPGTLEVPDEIAWQKKHLALEASVLVSFVYYELTSLAHMLKDLKMQIPQGELQYLVKARDKFLAHQMLHGPVRNAHGAMSIPRVGLLHAHAICADETDPVLIEYYRSSFAPTTEADAARFRGENEEMILSEERLSPKKRLRLKAFGIREPSLEASLEEMAKLLLTSALPEVERVSAQPIPFLP